MNPSGRAAGAASWDVRLALLYALLVFVVGSLPSAPPVARSVSDKTQHAVAFGLLAWMWCRALRQLRPQWSTWHVVLGGFGVSVALGGALELWQSVLVYRSCDVLDWVADALGGAAAAGAHGLSRRLGGGARPGP